MGELRDKIEAWSPYIAFIIIVGAAIVGLFVGVSMMNE